MKVIEFKIDLLEENIFICISRDSKLLQGLFPKANISEFAKTHLGLCFGAIHTDKKHRRVIWLKYWSNTTFVHEAYHLTRDLLIHYDIKDDETGALLFEMIYKKTMEGKRK